MSKYKNCALYADANTPPRYCCTRKVFTVGGDCCVQVTIIGPPVDLLLFPSGDTDDASMVAATLEAGVTTITEPGLYMLDLDCDALDGTTAPTDVAEQMLVCCKEVQKSDNALLCDCIATAIAEALGGELNVDVDLQPLIDKLCAGDVTAIAVLQEIIACLNASKITGQDFQVALLACMDALKVDLGAIITCLTEAKTADAKYHEAALVCFEAIKNNTAAITGIETAFGQLGCIFVDGVQTGSVLVCKVSPEDGGDPISQVHAYYTDGTVDLAYTGVWEPCTNLSQIQSTLEQILGSLDDLKGTKEPATIPGADQTSAVRLYSDRPPSSVPWALCQQDETTVIVQGSTLAEFRTNAEAMGYNFFSVGVFSTTYMCPCPALAGEVFILKVGENASKVACTPLAEIEGAPAKPLQQALCFLRTRDCDNDRRDGLLAELLACNKELQETLINVLCPPKCPELTIGAAEFITDSDNGNAGEPVTFPLISPVGATSDIGVPVLLDTGDACTIPGETLMTMRWCFDHSIQASTNHTGFNLSVSTGTLDADGNPVSITPSACSNDPATVDVGPGVTPHNGPRDKYWCDFEVPYSMLQNGVIFQTSAFGATNGEIETIHSQDLTLETDLSEFGCC